MRGRAAVLAGVIATSALVGCQSEVNFTVTNGLDVPIAVTRASEDHPPEVDYETYVEPIQPGDSRGDGLVFEEDPWPWNIWPFTVGAERCTDRGTYMYAVTAEGREFTNGPPLCEGETWVVSD